MQVIWEVSKNVTNLAQQLSRYTEANEQADDRDAVCQFLQRDVWSCM